MVHSSSIGDVLEIFSKKSYFKKFLEHLPNINCLPVSEFSLENVKIKMKLFIITYNKLVIYNLLNFFNK